MSETAEYLALTHAQKAQNQSFSEIKVVAEGISSPTQINPEISNHRVSTKTSVTSLVKPEAWVVALTKTFLNKSFYFLLWLKNKTFTLAMTYKWWMNDPMNFPFNFRRKISVEELNL